MEDAEETLRRHNVSHFMETNKSVAKHGEKSVSRKWTKKEQETWGEKGRHHDTTHRDAMNRCELLHARAEKQRSHLKELRKKELEEVQRRQARPPMDGLAKSAEYLKAKAKTTSSPRVPLGQSTPSMEAQAAAALEKMTRRLHRDLRNCTFKPSTNWTIAEQKKMKMMKKKKKGGCTGGAAPSQSRRNATFSREPSTLHDNGHTTEHWMKGATKRIQVAAAGSRTHWAPSAAERQSKYAADFGDDFK